MQIQLNLMYLSADYLNKLDLDRSNVEKKVQDKKCEIRICKIRFQIDKWTKLVGSSKYLVFLYKITRVWIAVVAQHLGLIYLILLEYRGQGLNPGGGFQFFKNFSNMHQKSDQYDY